MHVISQTTTGFSIRRNSIMTHSVLQNHENDYEEDFYLFDPNLLDNLTFDSSKVSFKNKLLSPQNPGQDLLLRPLSSADYDKGYTRTLSELTVVGDVSKELYLKRFRAMKQCEGTYFTIVLEDTKLSQVVASGTLLVEQKFIHECAMRGRIEDIVVRDEYKGRELGKIIVETLRLLGKKLHCYKTSLDCTNKMVPFYSKFGFQTSPVGNNGGGGVTNFMVERYSIGSKVRGE